MQIAHFQRAHLAGVEGHVELSEAPFNPPNDRPCVVRLQRGGEVQRLELEVCDQYRIQGDHFAEAILNDAPVPIPLEDAVGNMEVIDAIVASGCSGVWVQPDGGTSELAGARAGRNGGTVRYTRNTFCPTEQNGTKGL
jgi:predicted dehydrogenase